jgi:hypothetical protein
LKSLDKFDVLVGEQNPVRHFFPDKLDTFVRALGQLAPLHWPVPVTREVNGVNRDPRSMMVAAEPANMPALWRDHPRVIVTEMFIVMQNIAILLLSITKHGHAS